MARQRWPSDNGIMATVVIKDGMATSIDEQSAE